MTKVSIITPCYNAEAFILETFKSVTSQTFSDFEWIIVDDKSTDNTNRVLEKMARDDSRIKVFRNEKNMGAAFTRNACLSHARGEYYSFLDSDDLWAKDKLEEQIKFMESNDIDFSYHDYQTIGAEGKTLKILTLKNSYTHHDLLYFNPFATSSIMIKSSLIKEHQIRFKDHLRRRQDYFFWYDSLKASKKIKGLSKVLSSYRLDNKNSLSSNKFAMAKIQWKLYKDEFKLNFLQRIYYIFHYSIHGIKKYFL